MQRDYDVIHRDIDTLKKDTIEKCSLKEVLAIKQGLMAELKNKVELKEVQGVLNDCQNDLGEQLNVYKQKI
jgi:hypothetical protein